MPTDDRHRMTWHRARQTVGHLFPQPPKELAHILPDWPERMTVEQAAALQCAAGRTDREAQRLAAGIKALALAAIEAGELKAETETQTIPAEPAKQAYTRQQVASWEGGARTVLVRHEVAAKKARTVRTHWLRAHDFESWLRTMGETPSVHVTAWLAASASQLNALGDPRRARGKQRDAAIRERDRKWAAMFDEAWAAEQRLRGGDAQKKRALQQVARDSGYEPNDGAALERIRKAIERHRNRREPQARIAMPATIRRSAWCPT